MIESPTATKRRAAMAAVLALLIFALCRTIVGIADRMRFAAITPTVDLEPLLRELGNTTDAVSRQELLARLVMREPVITMAIVVGPDHRVQAVSPRDSRIIGRDFGRPGRMDMDGSFYFVPPLPPSMMPPGMPGGPGMMPEDPYSSGHSADSYGFGPPGAPGPPRGPYDDGPGRNRTRPSPIQGPVSDVDESVRRRRVQIRLTRLLHDPEIDGRLRQNSVLTKGLEGNAGEYAGMLGVRLRVNEAAYEQASAIARVFRGGSFFSLLIYWLMLPLWVFFDARPRTERALPLAVFVFLTNFLGWLTYLVIRPEANRVCPACITMLEPGYRLCPVCGWSGDARCRQCRRPLRAHWRFCPYCEAPRPETDTPPDAGTNV